MVCGCFSSEMIGPVVHVKETMDKHVYRNILVHHDHPALQNHKSSYFQQNNDPKHTAKTVKQYFNGRRIPFKLLEFPSHSPDLNPIES